MAVTAARWKLEQQTVVAAEVAAAAGYEPDTWYAIILSSWQHPQHHCHC